MPIFRLSKQIVFPDPELAEEEGLLAVGGDLRPERLVAAYTNGIFPWFSPGDPYLWFSPDPRMVLYPSRFKRSESLNRVIRSGQFELRVDTAFATVIRRCATAPRRGQDGTWITEEMQTAYLELHKMGLAHSFESYRDGKLVGGLYGVSLGGAFFGESMFHEQRDASKVALACLVEFAIDHEFAFIDAQQPTAHLKSLGAQEISRTRFLKELRAAQTRPTLQGSWTDFRHRAQA